MAQHPSPADEQAGAGLPFPTIRNVGLGAPFRWIARGFSDLKACPTASLFYGFCFTGMGLLVTFVFEHAYQYTSAVTTGFLLLAPFFAMGLYELSRRRELGEACALLPTLTVAGASPVGLAFGRSSAQWSTSNSIVGISPALSLETSIFGSV